MDGWMDGRMDRGVWLIHLKMIKTSYIPQMSSDTCYNSSDTNDKILSVDVPLPLSRPH